MDDQTSSGRRRWRGRRLPAALSVAALAVGGTQLVAAMSASAASTDVYVVMKTSTDTVRADVTAGGVGGYSWALPGCHPDDMLVGALVDIYANPEISAKITEIRPVLRPGGGLGPSMSIRVEIPSGAPAGPYADRMGAICVRAGGAVSDVEVVSESTPSSRETFQQAAARCPAGKRAVGTGAAVQSITSLTVPIGWGNGQVGLQLNRPSGPMDISRATAASAVATPAHWRLISYAICARIRAGADVAVHGTLAPLGTTGGEYGCPAGTRVYSIGGGGPLTYAGQSFLTNLSLTSTYPPDYKRFEVRMSRPPNQQVAIGAVCGPGSSR